MTTMRRKANFRMIASTLMGVVGLGGLWYYESWQVATLVFIMIWGNNIGQKKW